MKKVLGIIGVGGFIVGAVVTIYLLKKRKKEYDTCQKEKKFEEESFYVEDASMDKIMPTQEEPVYEDVKSSAIGNMYSRHEDAAVMMRDSVEIICENVKISEKINSEIDNVSAELDKMLCED